MYMHVWYRNDARGMNDYMIFGVSYGALGQQLRVHARVVAVVIPGVLGNVRVGHGCVLGTHVPAGDRRTHCGRTDGRHGSAGAGHVAAATGTTATGVAGRRLHGWRSLAVRRFWRRLRSGG